MPFPAIWTKSQRGQLSADYESVVFPGNTFIFLQKRKTQQCSYFRCAYCAKASKFRAKRNAAKLTVPIVRATLEEGFLDDPDVPFHPHFCVTEPGVDTSTFAANARYIYNKVKLELMDIPMTPRQAWLQMKAEVIANFPDFVIQQEIIRRLPSDKSAKRSFARRSLMGKRNLSEELTNLKAGEEVERDLSFLFDVDDDLEEENGDGEEAAELARSNDPKSIPLDLLKPVLSRPSWICAAGREKLANFFLIYRDCRPNCVPPFMVFSDMMGINLIHKCPDIVCDGNSNFFPRCFAQLFTFHAVHHSIPEEAHFCAFALLPNTASVTYNKLFDVISEKMRTEFGDLGVQRNWHFDNKLEAVNSCSKIFKDDNVEDSEEKTTQFSQLWHEHLRTLFFGRRPDLVQFIGTMREELTRASVQAERIFRPLPPIKSVNLDNIEMINKMARKEKHFSLSNNFSNLCCFSDFGTDFELLSSRGGISNFVGIRKSGDLIFTRSGQFSMAKRGGEGRRDRDDCPNSHNIPLLKQRKRAGGNSDEFVLAKHAQKDKCQKVEKEEEERRERDEEQQFNLCRNNIIRCDSLLRQSKNFVKIDAAKKKHETRFSAKESKFGKHLDLVSAINNKNVVLQRNWSSRSIDARKKQEEENGNDEECHLEEEVEMCDRSSSSRNTQPCDLDERVFSRFF